MNTIKEHKFFYGWIILACCTLIVMMNGGIFFTFSVFFIPVAKYFNWSHNETSLNFTAMLMAYAPGAYFGGKFADRYGSRRILIIVALLIGAGFIGCRFSNNLYSMIMSYISIGLGLGGTLAIPTAIVWRWFKKLRGLAIGIIYAGNGIGGLLFAPLTNYLLTVYNWRTTYLIIGLIFGGVIAISALFILTDPAMKKLRPYGYEDENSSHQTEDHSKYSLSKEFHKTTFWWVTILYILNFIPYFFITSHLIPYVSGKGITATIGSQGLGLIAGMSVIGRLVWGRLSEKIDWLKSEAICLFFGAFSLILMIFVSGVALFYVFTVIYGLSAASTVAVLGGVTSSRFGSKGGLQEILGFQLGIGVLFGAILPWAGGLIYDVTGSYLIVIIISVGVFMSGGLIALLLRPTG